MRNRQCILSVAFSLIIQLHFIASRCKADNGPYCGVYSLYGAAKAIGYEGRIDPLLDARFISSSAGSTTSDLQKAAEFIGVRATPVRGLGLYTLRTSQRPLILHVDPPGVRGVYTHWLLFLGISEGGKAVCYDGPGGISECSLPSLLARWDGKAIVIEPQTDPESSFLSHEIGVAFLIFAFCGVGLLTAQRLRFLGCNEHTRIPFHRGVFPLILLAVCFDTTHSFLIDESAREKDSVLHGFRSAFGQTSFDEVSAVDLQHMLNQIDVFLVDARYRRDFRKGTIEGAVNLPVGYGLGTINKLTEGRDRRAATVVFCNSVDCHFADIVAAGLVSEGFTDVKILRGGFDEWKQMKAM